MIIELERDIQQRLGLVPAMYYATPDTIGAVSALWTMACAGWLDNPLPSPFKQRLVVYLGLLSGSRYCLGRHVAWLRGSGRVLEPALAASSAQLLTLLQMPPPGDDEIRRATESLDACVAQRAEIAAPGGQVELAVFVAAGSLFLGKGNPAVLRASIERASGPARTAQILLLLTWFQAERQWLQAHPELAGDEDMLALFKREPEVAQLLEARLGQVESRDRQRDKFIGVLSHELRNPVASICAVSDMFQVIGIDDERLRNASNILHRQTHALGDMLDNLLEISNLAFGKVAMAKVPLVPDELLASVLRRHEAKFNDQGISVMHTPAERRVYVMADRTRLAQVFEQILSNAHKFAHTPGSLQIVTQVEPASLTIRFRDDGSGFAPDRASAIFEPFSQGRPHTAQQTSGLGIGLTIARMIAVLHDGALEAASAGPGSGATFTLRLPLASQDAGNKPEKKTAGRPVSRIRVLAIEDNKDFAQLFRHMLEIMGCELDITSDARSGLKLAHERLPELIFCDIGLPGDMNGIDFARAVRADPELAHIPLVAVSGYSSPEDRHKAMAAGFDRVCAKPVKFADISDALSVYSTHRDTAG
ncbi:MAG: hybrid sensor histidine kinase/response regulator [Lacisediminimonas sp.]|nr:hybrid sensor histidine kinase/response regulator [Lacisediminimonas sp.]